MTSPLNLYPISEKAPEQAVSASGLPLDRLTLDAVVSGRIGAADIRISAEGLNWWRCRRMSSWKHTR